MLRQGNCVLITSRLIIASIFIRIVRIDVLLELVIDDDWGFDILFRDAYNSASFTIGFAWQDNLIYGQNDLAQADGFRA